MNTLLRSHFDDVHVCKMLRRVLEYAGLQYEISVNAESVRSKAADFQPDAAIADFVLPDTDGIVPAQMLKENHPDLEIDMISGVPKFEETLGSLARAAEMTTFIAKPFRAAEILNAIRYIDWEDLCKRRPLSIRQHLTSNSQTRELLPCDSDSSHEIIGYLSAYAARHGVW